MKKTLYFLAALILLSNIQCVNADVIDGRFYPTNITLESTQQPIDNLIGNYNHKIKFIFSDIDGTIIPFDKTGEQRGKVPESAQKAVLKLQQANIPIVLATGRSSGEARLIAKRLGLEKAYVIGQQGGEIVNPEGKMIYLDSISNKDTLKMLKEIDSFNKKHGQNSKSFFYVDGKAYSFEKFTPPYIIDEINQIKSYDDLKPNFSAVKVGIVEMDFKKLKAIQLHMKEKFPNYHVDISADCYCDITKMSATKGNAVEKLAKILKIGLQDAAIFGDAENDITMLNLVKKSGGLAIAVGNAMDSVKRSANYITAPATEGGFAKGIDKILENNATIH